MANPVTYIRFRSAVLFPVVLSLTLLGCGAQPPRDTGGAPGFDTSALATTARTPDAGRMRFVRKDASMAVVIAMARSATHSFSKIPRARIDLVAGPGVECNAYKGSAARHPSRVARDPTQPNRRQVHLIHAELHDEQPAAGFTVGPGDLGENVTTPNSEPC